MSGETAQQVSGWTVDTLRAHLEIVLAERDKRYEQALIAAEKAISKAETATEKRFDAVNEFRAQLADQATTFLTRKEYDGAHLNVVEKVASVDKRLTDALSVINSRLDTGTGRAQGYNALYGWLIAGVGLLISVVVVVNVLTSHLK